MTGTSSGVAGAIVKGDEAVRDEGVRDEGVRDADTVEPLNAFQPRSGERFYR